MELVPYDHPLLRKKLKPFDFEGELRADDLAQQMAEVMRRHSGIGIAANQVGIDARVFLMWGAPLLACFNPRIVDYAEETALLDEGCLSFPGLTVKVRRPKWIRCRFQAPDGNVLTRRFEGMTARVFQHEYSHLEGELYFNRCSRPKLEAALKRAAKEGHVYPMSIVKRGRAA
jgi:peptide deformylase